MPTLFSIIALGAMIICSTAVSNRLFNSTIGAILIWICMFEPFGITFNPNEMMACAFCFWMSHEWSTEYIDDDDEEKTESRSLKFMLFGHGIVAGILTFLIILL
jgi:hypothetical protein